MPVLFESSAMSIWYEYLERYFKEKIDFLIVTGDLHQYEKRPRSGIGNYKKSIDELNKPLEHIGLDGKKNVFMVPGNHDTANYPGKKKLLEKIDKEAKNDCDCYNEYKEKLEAAMDVYQKFVYSFYGAEDIYSGVP